MSASLKSKPFWISVRNSYPYKLDNIPDIDNSSPSRYLCDNNHDFKMLWNYDTEFNDNCIAAAREFILEMELADNVIVNFFGSFGVNSLFRSKNDKKYSFDDYKVEIEIRIKFINWMINKLN